MKVGNTMAWESVKALEHYENLNLGCSEDTREEPVAARISRGLRLPSSLYLKMLGFSLAAQQFTTASAEGICHDLSGVTKKFDLIGLISAFGTAAATKSLSFSALNDGSFYLTGHIGPGSLSVASLLLKATGTQLARLLTVGGAGDAYGLVQLDSPEGLRYIGLKSNTECPVRNVVGASIVREYQSHWNEIQQQESWALMEGRDGVKDVEVEGGRILGRRVGRDAKREVKVIILKVGRTEKEEDLRTKELPISLKSCKGGDLLLGWLPLLLTIGVAASCYNCNELFVARLILWGTLGMMVAVLGLRGGLFKYSKPLVAKGAPQGDCLIVDERDGDLLHVVIGDEGSIQALFQRKIDYQASLGKHLLSLASSILYLYVAASVLYMPNVSTSGQIHFAIANLIGFATDMVKASYNGKLGLAKKAREQFNIVPADVVVFRNRTAAVAFVSKHAKDRSMLKSKKLLPCDGTVWQKWWEILAKCDGEADDSYNSIKSVVAAAEPKDQELLKILLDDMKDGLQA